MPRATTNPKQIIRCQSIKNALGPSALALAGISLALFGCADTPSRTDALAAQAPAPVSRAVLAQWNDAIEHKEIAEQAADRPVGSAETRPKLAGALIADRWYDVPVGVTAAVPAKSTLSSVAAASAQTNLPVSQAPSLNTVVAAASPASMNEPPAVVAQLEPATAPDKRPVSGAAVENRSEQVKPAPKQPVMLAAAGPAALKLDVQFESFRHAVKFAFNRGALGPQARALVAKVLPEAKLAASIKLTGFADGIGPRSANERIAKARAMAVRNELVKNDVQLDKITINKPVVLTAAKAKQPSWYYAQYRRVDVDITKPKTDGQVVSLSEAGMRP